MSSLSHRGGDQADRQSEACAKPKNGELGTDFTASDTPPRPYGSPRAAAGPAKGQRLFPCQARRLHSPRCTAGPSSSRGLGLGNKPTPPNTIQKLHKPQFLRHTGHTTRTQSLPLARGYQTGPRRHRPFLSWQDVLLGGCSRPQPALSWTSLYRGPFAQTYSGGRKGPSTSAPVPRGQQVLSSATCEEGQWRVMENSLFS